MVLRREDLWVRSTDFERDAAMVGKSGGRFSDLMVSQSDMIAVVEMVY